jgi:hypothetical protein
MEDQSVSIGIAEGGEMADARVPRLGDELDPLRFELGPCCGDIRHSQRETGLVRDER